MARKETKKSEYSKKHIPASHNHQTNETPKLKASKSALSYFVYRREIDKNKRQKIGMRRTNLAYARILENEDYGINKAIAFLKSRI